ncbi:MAG: Signal transduction histidine kinase [Candidatus Falkowbacteria bacterium GW2011_GWC2_38_22]|uniref:Signal transduction histidine kinase n=1 Tax=Candidatus Falkowbacteria bacterium GW2011_GWE1_38_31 TaxID=1618638 RepID=A0A0G0JWA2_9BACT|nr:MAG: Signal transduction histidine kinase [Candidatus Falkowbacteria bacterium GW2011_GWF2_38_1205]KKQ62077.1 MAG: Signal transduction histidine kinase [Candidatus Falkowbacteria bacterium GW2011_GWC2_38_22]KKQ64227.1 MAG: Signal transduction histidine kinase [Candidatus Falkowbacteria bacterium GW2011_GWF1_38_22]KKQ66204.1 MAG: Signal transduction histidine kinase [Candidatus Falkowbacteria bacterium GW2011_GWE2_38_254]KKQ70932.1 MAG: Signal transduction histidine kinase [Candidatus Falkowb
MSNTKEEKNEKSLDMKSQKNIACDIDGVKIVEKKLVESKQILEGIINAIPVRVFWKDLNLVYLGCNKIFANDAGFNDPKELIGKDDFSMIWREQAELYRKDDMEVIKSGIAKKLIEEPQTTPDGKIITLLTSKMPLRDSAGKIIGVLGTYMDISERKNYEDELKKSKEILQSKVKELQRFNRVITDRELKMIELKKEISELKARLGGEESEK